MPRFAPVPVPESTVVKTKLTIELDEKAVETLDTLQKQLEKPSRIEVIRFAIKLLKFIWQEREAGNVVGILSKDTREFQRIEIFA